ncbi:MAG TPA: GAF domain-containing SpoIIE family protein phosphatase [Candidatus Dormibacteraeota bacterium]|nr:GAF domain-containing SpoIIE family protein phosphatase [Candidatus Dormibacteraeota bacterium]
MAEDAAQLRLLYELGCAFAARIDLDELSALVVQKCREVLDAEGASILLLDPERDELYFPYVADTQPDVAARLLSLRFPADRGIAGAVLRSGQSLRIDDASKDPRFFGGVDRRTGMTTRALICAPLETHQGTIGVIQVLNPRHGGCFDDDDLAFLEALAGSVAIAIENARMYAQLKQQYLALQQAMHEHEQLLAIQRELEIASNIQQSILPRVFPPFPDRADFELFAEMTPAREVGGDFYDFFLIDDRHLGLVVGDVSGKGMPAALFMAVSRTLLKSNALAGLAPGECLQRVNQLLCLENSAEMFVSIFYGILDTRSGRFEYCNGGHNRPYLLRLDGAAEVLEGTGGSVLGVLPDGGYAARSTTLRPGEALFLYSDGVTEAMDASGALFSDARLRATLERRGGAAPEALIAAVMEELGRHAGGVAQSDDITTLAVRWRGDGRLPR